MSNRQKLIPEIRFPEFKNDGEWKLKALEDALDYERPDNYIVSDTNYQNEGTPVLTANKSFILGYTNEDFGIYEKLPAIIFDDFTVDNKFVDFPFKVKSSAIKILTPKKKDDLRFTYELISQINFNAAEHKRYYISEYQKINLPFPSINEQQKIASCLSSLDEVIETHSQKLDLLRDHKKGLMQNLFPQEGEKVPKLRFKEFEEDEDWVKKRLGDLGHFLGGGTPSRSNDDYWIGNIPWISSSDIKEDDIHNISISQYINENAIIESATKIIPKGSILFVSRVGVGKLAINNEELCTSQDFTSFIPAEVLNLFVAYYYSANKNALESLSQGTSIKGFSKSDLEDSIILYPKNPKEQQKIASCLSALDELITAQAKKIERLKQHKKGLMQGLFPKTEN